ncbi:MAG: hypothetical protein PQJ44_09520 [Sphaerochaetaceae bacterium]|nr:hypothetical protein [Sphaerochaetaceae bacterium]
MIFDNAINYLTELSGVSVEVMQTLFLGLSLALTFTGLILVLRLFKRKKRRRYR